jgi:hypothetical protein
MNLIERTTRVVGGEIDRKARELGREQEIAPLLGIEKVRYIQRLEGNKDCFCRDEPLEPSADNQILCAIDGCCWKPACDYHRLLNQRGQTRPGDWDPGTVGGGGGGGIY